jgi:alanine dehydrogenase
VVIIGGGVVGSNAAKTASGFGCKVIILDINVNILEHLENILPVNVFTQYSNSQNLETALSQADIVIGAVLVPGAKAPKLVTKEHLKIMKTNSVLVDVAIDQGGCTETSKPTTHDDPIFVVDDVIHYCVANMPGAYARTSTFALNNVTIPYGLELANKGAEQACKDNHVLCRGLNAYKGTLTCMPVGEAFGIQDVCKLPEEVI